MSRRRKNISHVLEQANIKKFAEEHTPETIEIMNKLHLNKSMTPLKLVTTIREYLERQSNPERTCNNILYRLGINKQFNGRPRQARIYAMTAIDEAMTNGLNFNPSNVPAIAEKRYNRIVGILGRDTDIDVDIKSNINDSVKIKSKKEIAVELYKANQDKTTGELVKLIMEKLKIEKSNAYSVLSAAKKSLIV